MELARLPSFGGIANHCTWHNPTGAIVSNAGMRAQRVRSALLFFFLVALIAALGTNAVAAQSDARVVSTKFEATSTKVRALLKQPPGNYDHEKTAELSGLREELARFRDRAAAMADRGTLESRLVKAQLDALGDPPGEGEVEPSAVSSRREELLSDQSAILEPELRWREAAIEAATLVEEIDERIALLEHGRLVGRSATLFEPRSWSALQSDLRSVSSGIGSESPFKASRLLVLIAILLVTAGAVTLAVFFVSRSVNRKIEARLATTTNTVRQLALLLLRDSLSAALYLIAAIASLAVVAAMLRPFLGTDTLLATLLSCVVAGLMIAFAHWLGRSAFLSPLPELRLISFRVEKRMRAARYVTALGVILAFEEVLELFEALRLIGTALGGVASTFLILAGSSIIWKFGSLIGTAVERTTQDDKDFAAQGVNLTHPISRAIKVLAICAVVTALIGYVMLARDIFVGMVLTLAVLGTGIFVQRSIRLAVVAASQGPLGQYRGFLRFLPLSTGFILLVGSLFLIALIWGYKYDQIADGINALRVGVQFGDIRFSAGDLLTFALVFFLGFVATRWIQRFLRISVLPDFEIERGVQSAVITGLGYVGIIISALVAIASTGLDLSSLAFVAGALSVGLGFGLQSVVENFVSGIILLVERPIREGDWIEVDEYSGIVRKIAVRATQIETFDRHYVVVPNSKFITGNVKNLSFSGGAARIIVIIGVSYDTDLTHAKELLLKIARENDAVLPDPEPVVAMDGFGESSMDLKLLCFVADPTQGAGPVSAINFEIARQFAQEGIEIPFPQRDLHIRSGSLPPTGPQSPMQEQGPTSAS